MNVRVFGILICRYWTPSQRLSNGSSVNVGLDVTLTPLQPPNQPWYDFWKAFMCLQARPMGSNTSPYSSAVQLPSGVSANDAPVQRSDDECCMPKLWSGSCTSTTQLVEALYQ